MRNAASTFGLAVLVLVGVGASGAPPAGAEQGWPVYAADDAATHYSPLTDLDKSSIGKAQVLWEWKTGDDGVQPPAGARPGAFENTPLMIDDTLYVSSPFNRVAALDAETGREKWTYDPHAYDDGQPPNGTGFVHRGVAAWRDGGQLRIFMNSRAKLICLDAATGRPVDAFGTHGVVDLTQGLRWPVDPKRYTNTSPPVVYKDLVILGNGVGDRMTYRQDPPGDVRAFDARTGRQVWSFHTVPAAGEPGVETWGDESWKTTGHTNVWAPMSLDAARGLLYLPVSTPSNDHFGGRRPGANLYGESIVCLEAATGAVKWYFQIVHHGLWDYDPASAPSLVHMTVGGRPIDGVVQLTKQGFAFVFDRVTGKPVWPIEEKAVPPSDVAGEHAWPTQPVPTRPAAFAPQGMTLDDAFDLTPALKAAAQAELSKYRLGPIYTPPSVQGTFTRPGVIGGANWGGAAFDPATGLLYVKISNSPAVLRIVPGAQANGRAGESDAEWAGAQGNATFAPPGAGGAAGGGGAGGRGNGRGGVRGLPLVKPPYGEVVAINLNTGAIAWRTPFGDMPSLRNHPALAGVTLPPTLGSPGAWGVIVTKSGLVIGGTSDDSALHALDAATGAEIWKLALPRPPSATPMTYRTSHGHQFIVIATGSGPTAELVAVGTIPGAHPVSSLGRQVAPSGHMPRRALGQATNVIFHVMNRAARKMRLFETPEDYAAFLSVLEEARRRTGIELLAYCVMPNHFHLLVKPVVPGQLSEFMRWFQLTHAKRWRRFHDSEGHGAVYQGRFQAVPVQDDSHFIVAARYVERNPVRAGLVPRAELWNWSSLAQRCRNCNDVTLTTWPIQPSDDWLRTINCPEPQAQMSAFRGAIQDRQPFGSAEWTTDVVGQNRQS